MIGPLIWNKPGRPARIKIDGMRDIQVTRAVSRNHAGGWVGITVELLAREGSEKNEVVLTVPDETQAALLALGWTPPEPAPGEPAEIAVLPPDVVELIAAVNTLSLEWPDADDDRRANLSTLVYAVNQKLWNRLRSDDDAIADQGVIDVAPAPLIAYYKARTCKPADDEIPPTLLDKVRDVHRIQGQRGTWNASAYMRGLYNGLELALSILEGERDPEYKDAPAEDGYLCDRPTPDMSGPEFEPVSDDDAGTPPAGDR